MTQESDLYFMKLALEEAEHAYQLDEVPIGAVVVSPDGVVAGRGCNRPISSDDPTAHAEIVAMREAALFTKNYRLSGFTLYVTLEPCIMCFGAMVQARIGRLVFGAPDRRTGLTRHLDFINRMNLNHRFDIAGPIMEAACGELLVAFFQTRR